MPPSVVTQLPVKAALLTVSLLLPPNNRDTASEAVGHPEVPDWKVAAVVQLVAAAY